MIRLASDKIVKIYLHLPILIKMVDSFNSACLLRQTHNPKSSTHKKYNPKTTADKKLEKLYLFYHR